MKDFAKSIRTAKTTWCNKKTGNKATILKDGDVWVVLYANETKSQEFDTEEEAKKFAAKVGNAKDKNGIELKVGDVVAVKTDDPKLNHGKIKRISGDQVSVDVTGNDDIWTTPARLVVKMGNSKIGNREISLSASNSGELNLYDDGTGFMYDPIELGRYDIDGKSDAMATVRELEKLKRNAETKIKDCQKFIDTLKQWANGLK